MAAATEKSGVAGHHGGRGLRGHGSAGADENGEGVALSSERLPFLGLCPLELFHPLVGGVFQFEHLLQNGSAPATQFAQVWAAALCATTLLYMAQWLFVIYLKNFATLNAVYGAFGGIMALLLWIYLCGCIFIFGACLCAAQAEGAEKRRIES